MQHPAHYEICIEGHLSSSWSEWFAGLALRCEPNNTTILYGTLEDQAALHGVLMKIRDLRLVLLSVNRKDESDVHDDR